MTKRNNAPLKKGDFKGVSPESWCCIDCGVNTAPGCSTRAELEQAFTVKIWATEGVTQTFDEWSEVYMVMPKIWKAAGMDAIAGCLCIGCLEKRLGRLLTPKDFNRKHPFHSLPGTKRLLARRVGEET
jgi:hypothetical protein